MGLLLPNHWFPGRQHWFPLPQALASWTQTIDSLDPHRSFAVLGGKGRRSGGEAVPYTGSSVPLVRSRVTAISGLRLQILCPKFLGRRNMFDENAVFLEVSVSQNLGHRIWDPFPLSAPTVRRPLPLYAGGAGVSGGGVRRLRRPSQLDRVLHAARAAAAGRCACYAGGSGGRVVRASRPAGRIGRVSREGGEEGRAGAAGPRGDPAACGSGGDPSVIQCHHASPRPHVIDRQHSVPCPHVTPCHACQTHSPLQEGRIDIYTTGKSNLHLHRRAPDLTFTLHEVPVLLNAAGRSN